ncbi:hypothetical protein FA15DRAFT_740506 [Coprinopsis marcescibilis]|uniref:Uncharacterized protein n=1 Tax=Coprinopsis marcescibilis TaxID=230819 RepID=A0A5C3KAV4_COPMA|nr:hypothetical protein FA15DRAFT_740506 [Coprinopsis marcescibilis]
MASLDFASAPSQHSLYGQHDLNESSFVGVLPPSLSDLGADTKPSINHQAEALDTPEHSNYDLFPNNQQGAPFSSQRYRTNASSSSSLGHSYAMNSEAIYSHSSFSDSVPSFGSPNGNPYDMINGIPSSYSSGKVSPLTPSDPVGGIHHSFPPSVNGKDYSQPQYSDMTDRRLSMNNGNGYPSEYADDYSMNGINNNSNNNNGLAFSQSIPQFPDRLGRYSSDRYGHPQAQHAVPSHLSSTQSNDMMRGIPPHATQSFNRDAGTGYDSMHYMSPNPHRDMSIRMTATVDETLAQMKLQPPPMGASNDLQTFIRYSRHRLKPYRC